jgi:hypothetical protein
MSSTQIIQESKLQCYLIANLPPLLCYCFSEICNMKQIYLNLDCETNVRFEPTQVQSSLCL